MNSEQKYFNNEAKRVGEMLSSDDRKILMYKFSVDESYLSHLFSGNRKAKRGKGLEIIEFAKRLATINSQKLELA